MSVPEYKRGESEQQFLYTARQIHIHTLKKTKSWPKSYTFRLAVPMCQMAFDIYRQVVEGNSIYPTNQREVQMRRECFLKAKATLHAFSSMIEVSREAVGYSMDGMKFWIGMVAREIKLINGLIKSDRERFKNVV